MRSAIKELENQIGFRLKNGVGITEPLQDLKALGYSLENKGKQNLVFSALRHGRPAQLKELLNTVPWLLTSTNVRTAYENLSFEPTSIDEAKRRGACWLELNKLYPFKSVSGHGRFLKNILKNKEACVELFEAVIKTINVLERGEGNRTILHELCGVGRPGLEPLNDHIAIVRRYTSDKRIATLLDAEQARMAEHRLLSSKRGSYGSTLGSIKDAGGGWISEDGAYIAASGFRHIECLEKALPVNHPVAEWLKPRAAALKAYIEEEENEFAASCSCRPGEHPEGHLIEIWADNQHSEFRSLLGKEVADRGWVRLYHSERFGLCAEGKPEALEKYKNDIELLAVTMEERRPINYTPYKGLKVHYSLPDSVINPIGNGMDIL